MRNRDKNEAPHKASGFKGSQQPDKFQYNVLQE